MLLELSLEEKFGDVKIQKISSSKFFLSNPSTGFFNQWVKGNSPAFSDNGELLFNILGAQTVLPTTTGDTGVSVPPSPVANPPNPDNSSIIPIAAVIYHLLDLINFDLGGCWWRACFNLNYCYYFISRIFGTKKPPSQTSRQ